MNKYTNKTSISFVIIYLLVQVYLNLYNIDSNIPIQIMEYSDIKYPRKNKAFMEESRTIIKELLASLTTQTAQKEDLLVTVKELKDQLSHRDSEIQKQTQTIATLSNELKSLKVLSQESKLRKQGEVQMMNMQLKNKREQLSKIESKNHQLQTKNRQLEIKYQEISYKNQAIEMKNKQMQQKLTQKEQKISELQKSLNHSKGLVAAAQNHINFLKQQVEMLREKIAEQEITHEKQLEGIKDLNVNITQKLGLIQKDYSSIIKYNDSISNTYQSPQSRARCRSNPKKKEKHIPRQKQRESRKRDSSNPQMQTELLKIKRSITNQYEKFGETRDKFMKDRVNKTLFNIETLLSEMSQKVEVDSSSYDM